MGWISFAEGVLICAVFIGVVCLALALFIKYED